MKAGKLPEEWVLSTIDEVCSLNPKIKLDDDLDVGFMPMANVPTNYLGKCNFETKKWNEVKKGFTQFQNGDVIFAKITPCFENGKASVIKGFPNGHGAGSTEYYVLRSINGLINPYWLFSLVKTKEFLTNGALHMSGSVGHKRVTKEFVEDYCLPIPPLAEQKFIADKLDTLLAQVDNTKARLEKIPKILKRFRQAVLAAAVSGKLTEDYGENQVVTNWDTTTLGTLIIDSCNGLAKRSGTDGEDITILRLADFKNAQRIHGNERKITLDSKEINKYSLKKSDILVIRVNGSADLAGRFIEYKQNDDIEGFCDHFIRLRLNSEKISSRFLTFIASEGEGRFYLRNSLSTSAGQNTINQTSIKGLALSLPPLPEQQEIVRRVEQLFAYADTIEKQVNNALTRVNNLTQSILAKAFRGELTAQWRAENPDLISGENSAAALLEKIKAERAATGGKKASRKKT